MRLSTGTVRLALPPPPSHTRIFREFTPPRFHSQGGEPVATLGSSLVETGTWWCACGPANSSFCFTGPPLPPNRGFDYYKRYLVSFCMDVGACLNFLIEI